MSSTWNVEVTSSEVQALRADVVLLLWDGATPLAGADSRVLKEAASHLGLGRETPDGWLVRTRVVGKRVQELLVGQLTTVKHFSREEAVRILAARAGEHARQQGAASLAVALGGAPDARLAALVTEGLLLGDYRTRERREKPATASIAVARPAVSAAQGAVRRASALAAAVNHARRLVDTPPSDLVPEQLAAEARRMAKGTGIECEIWGAKDLRKRKFAGVLAVGQGSRHEPHYVRLSWNPMGAGKEHLVLVGKAVTFDTGGISLKPAKDMWRMKGDMAGGAAVLGAMQAIAALGVRARVTALIPAVQNAVGSRAILPGDIIRYRNGKTVHVDNTDAEGRLILADALLHAKEIGGTHVVNVATLTGAIVRALGTGMAGLFANSDPWADAVHAAGVQAGEVYWRLPLWEEYREMLKVEMADITNSTGSVNAGAITAALFLSEFVDKRLKWAHLDIAGVYLGDKRWKYHAPGATGFGVRTLAELAARMPGASGT